MSVSQISQFYNFITGFTCTHTLEYFTWISVFFSLWSKMEAFYSVTHGRRNFCKNTACNRSRWPKKYTNERDKEKASSTSNNNNTSTRIELNSHTIYNFVREKNHKHFKVFLSLSLFLSFFSFSHSFCIIIVCWIIIIR